MKVKKKTTKKPVSFAGNRLQTIREKSSDGFTADNTVTFKCTGGRKLAESVSDHVFRDEHGNKSLAVMHIEGMTDKIRNHHRTTGPSLDRSLFAGFLHFLDLFDQIVVHEWRPSDGWW